MAYKDLATQKHYELTPKEKEAKAIHIFVDTDFKIANNHTPIHVLTMIESLRYIRGLEYLIDKTFEHMTDEVAQIVRTHYAKNEGKILPWGEIKRYHFQYKAAYPAIVFDPTGNIIDESTYVEGHTVLSVDGKEMTPFLSELGGEE